MRKHSTVVLGVLCALVFVFPQRLSAQRSSLPPEVQADILKSKILKSLEAKDFKGVLVAADQFEKLKLPVPPPIRFIEAKAAAATVDPIRAFATLQDFMATADRNSKQYKEALDLYPKYESDPAVQAKIRAEAQAMGESNARLAEIEAKRNLETKGRIEEAQRDAAKKWRLCEVLGADVPGTDIDCIMNTPELPRCKNLARAQDVAEAKLHACESEGQLLDEALKNLRQASTN